VPLISEGAAIGVVILATTHGRTMSGEDADLAAELGRRAGEAVERARLYADRDRVARTLQRSLRPPRIPVLPGIDLAAFHRPWTAGMDIGGDFYDVVRTGNAWWLVLGDVCGKGPAAAATTAAVRYALRALVQAGEDPARVLERLNQVLLNGEGECPGQERFTTMVMGFLTPRENSVDLCLASAGHPPCLLRSRDGGVRAVGTGGMPLGIFPEISLTAETLRLERGDCLLMYTDGATEARDATGQELGEDTLRHLLADSVGNARNVVDAVSSGVLSRTVELRDDLALLALAVPGAVSGEGGGREQPGEGGNTPS
jgi:phosphoserine phosphatase RsbU/P